MVAISRAAGDETTIAGKQVGERFDRSGSGTRQRSRWNRVSVKRHENTVAVSPSFREANG
jgi:hypothetical protein